MLYILKNTPTSSNLTLEPVGEGCGGRVIFYYIKNMYGIKNVPKLKMTLQIVLKVIIILYQNNLSKQM